MSTPSSPPYRLRLLNDYEVVVAGLRTMLMPYQDRIRIVETDVGTTGDRAVDLTLYDTFGLTQADGSEIDEVLRDPEAGHVVIYSWNMQADLIQTALNKGCRGYIDKSMGAGVLVECLEAIGAGEVLVSDTAEIVDPAGAVGVSGPTTADPALARGAWPGQAEGLTAREAEIVALITRGLTNAEIATRSYITINSLKSCIRSAYRKMGVERRSQAVRWGMEHGMVPPRKEKLPQ
ncbi:response regulator transcription factor [Corynebacterium glyciniphilum]|uniref:response regulator transcription factor n=1 Tax=Corynebacterium glyciniphilum TaxID=1404244 RepID=UPI0021B30DB8|nr:response regulator transcription factor [Corynebacterium glyciniphilum]